MIDIRGLRLDLLATDCPRERPPPTGSSAQNDGARDRQICVSAALDPVVVCRWVFGVGHPVVDTRHALLDFVAGRVERTPLRVAGVVVTRLTDVWDEPRLDCSDLSECGLRFDQRRSIRS